MYLIRFYMYINLEARTQLVAAGRLRTKHQRTRKAEQHVSEQFSPHITQSASTTW